MSEHRSASVFWMCGRCKSLLWGLPVLRGPILHQSGFAHDRHRRLDLTAWQSCYLIVTWPYHCP